MNLYLCKGNSLNKTKKKKIRKESETKIKLWNIFDDDIGTPLQEIVPSLKGEEREFCEKCNTRLVVSEDGFMVCSNQECGVVYTDIVLQTAEWTYYGTDDNKNSDPTRCGMPINPYLKDSSYSCKIMSSSKMTYEMRKIMKYNDRKSMPHKELTLYRDFQRISHMAQIGNIPKIIIDDAIDYHHLISKNPLSRRGENREGIIAASIYLACRKNNCPRTTKEIAQIFNLNHKNVSWGFKNVQSFINEHEDQLFENEKTDLAVTTPKSFIQRFCSKLNINNELTNLCLFISIKVEKDNIMPTNTPPSIAAGVVYFISCFCNLNITKYQVKQVSEISEVTINKCYKTLEENTHKLIPTTIMKKYS